MQTKDVIKTCAALVKLGKKPTVGLVRAKLANKVPIAAVVKGIQQYQSNRQLGIAMIEDDVHEDMSSSANNSLVESSSQAQNVCGCENRVLLLEQQIEALKRQLTDLQTQVQGLVQR